MRVWAVCPVSAAIWRSIYRIQCGPGIRHRLGLVLHLQSMHSKTATDSEAAKWFHRCLGPLPLRESIRVESQDIDNVGPWNVERLQFRCGAQDPVTAVLVRPEGIDHPPVVIAHHGYGEGKDIFMFGRYSGYKWVRQPGAANLVSSGLAVLGIDAHGHGPRLKDAPDRSMDKDAWQDAFVRNWEWFARKCIIRGVAVQGLLIHDVQCAIDYLESRGDVDASRLGMYGYSMGGTTCWSTTVIEPRIKAAVAGGCMINYETALRVRRDASWHAWVPALCQRTSREALVASIAPRPLLAVHGEDDFPYEGVAPILDAASAEYNQCGCPELFRSVFLPGDHTAAADNPRLVDETGCWLAKHL